MKNAVYSINFCEQGRCYNKQHKCIYPKTKTGILESLFPITDKKITLQSFDISVDSEYKFAAVNTSGVWSIILKIGKLPEIKYTSKSTSTTSSLLNFHIPIKDSDAVLKLINFSKPIPIEC